MSRAMVEAAEQGIAEMAASSSVLSKIEAVRNAAAGGDEAAIARARDEAHSALDAQLDAVVAGRRWYVQHMRELGRR